MTVFFVASRDANSDLESAIAVAYPEKFYKFADRVWLVASKGTAREVSEKIGAKKGGFAGVLVMPTTGSYYGVASSAVWDWLRAALEDAQDG